MVAVSTASRKFSLPAALTLGPATDESKSTFSSLSASAAQTQLQVITLDLRLLTVVITLMGVHSFLDKILQVPALYLLAVTFIHLTSGGYNSSLKFCEFRAFACTAAIYTLFHSVVDDPMSFYGAGVLLYLIFGGASGVSNTYRSIYPLDTVQKVEGNGECRGINDPSLVLPKSPVLDDVNDVLKGMYKLPVVYELDPTDTTETILLFLGRSCDAERQSATDEPAPEDRLSLSPVETQIDSAPIDVRVDTPVQTFVPLITTVDLPPGSFGGTDAVQAHSSIAAIGCTSRNTTARSATQICTSLVAVIDLDPCNPTVTTAVTTTARSGPPSPIIANSTFAHPPLVRSGEPIEEDINPGIPTTVSGDSSDNDLGTSLYSVVDTLSYKQSTEPTASDSTGSTHTLPSSDDGGIALDDCDTDGFQESEEGEVGEFIPATCSQNLVTVTADRLVLLRQQHENPEFHDGSLQEVYDMAWQQRIAEVNDVYNPDDPNPWLWEVGSIPDRPVAADAKDIERMLLDVWQNLPEHQQQIITNGGLHAYCRGRDGMTGLNFFIRDLELLWFQKRTLDLKGTVLDVTDLQMVVRYEMARTRDYRPASPRGAATYTDLRATYRQYLTDTQEVAVNEGCSEYAPRTEQAAQSATIEGPETHPNHAGARSKNPVPGWLDRTVGITFYDPDAYLPCICGKKARQAHLESRNVGEPGYDPDLYVSEELQPALLGDEALEEDRARKAQDEGSRAGFPRSQGSAQECPLHAIPTNKPWILMDGVKGPNNLLVGTMGELPAPGFTTATVFPTGFRMPYGFAQADSTVLPPRCEHGLLHPPFADACMRCFPTGEHDEECAECDKHEAVKPIKQNPKYDNTYEQAMKGWDEMQMEHMRQGKVHEERMVEVYRSVGTDYYTHWPALTDV